MKTPAPLTNEDADFAANEGNCFAADKDADFAANEGNCFAADKDAGFAANEGRCFAAKENGVFTWLLAAFYKLFRFLSQIVLKRSVLQCVFWKQYPSAYIFLG